MLESVTCMAVGSAQYRQTAWNFPPPEDYESLGILKTETLRFGRAEDQARYPASLDCGYPVHLLANFLSDLREIIVSFKPDVVWAQLEGSRDILATAREMGVQGLLYVHDAEFNASELRSTAALNCHVICSSNFLATKVSSVIGRPAHVIYPASDWHFGTLGDTHGLVTMVNPCSVKGIDTTLELARRMPQQQFLLVESWKLEGEALDVLQGRLIELPNVHLQRRVSDMREVYRRTRLLLAPSIWEEGFGMVALEAQSCGIPVIASMRGGLPESVGDGGILVRDYRNVDSWMHAIQTVLSDDMTYRNWSSRALAHARSAKFDRQESARRFLAICAMPAPRHCRASASRPSILTRLRSAPLLGALLRGTRR